MQLPLLSELTVNCDAVTKIFPAIEFECVMEGKSLVAKLTHQEDNGFQFIYHISFSDGHSASFVAPMQAGNWHQEDFASPYAKAIRDDLDAICGFLPARPPICIRLKGEKEPFNVWVVPHVYKAFHYSVFYKGDYQFDVRRAKVWEAKSVRDNSYINGEIASLVCRNIEKRLLQPELL